MSRAQTNAPTLKLITATMTDRRQAGATESPIVNLTVQADERLLLTVVEAAHRLEISRSLLNELLATGQIESIYVGRLLRIPVGTLNDYVNRQRPQHPNPAA
jgi:excisionase family DNA binding protein